MGPERPRRWWLWGLVLLVCMLGSWWHSFRPLPPVPLRPGPDTTHAPRADGPGGIPDYERLLSEELSRGVTLDNNAAIPLLRALGWKAFGITDESSKQKVSLALGLDLERPQEQVLDGKGLALILKGVKWTNHQENPETPLPRALGPWMKANRTPLDLLVAASRRTHLYFHVLRDFRGTLTTASMPPLFQVTNALHVRGWLALQSGDQEAVLTDAAALMRLGDLRFQAPGLGPTAQGARQRTLGEWLLRRLLARADLQVAVLDQALTLQRVPVDAPSLARQLEQQRYEVLDLLVHSLLQGHMLDGRAFGGLPGSVSFDVEINLVLSQVNAAHDRAVAALKRGSFAERLKGLAFLAELGRKFQEVSQQAHSLKAMLLRLLASSGHKRELATRALGARFAAMALAGWPQILRLRTGARASRKLLQIACALRLFAARHRAYPDSLAQLTPDILPELPPDPFSGKAFHYELTQQGCLLTSAGWRIPRSSNDYFSLDTEFAADLRRVGDRTLWIRLKQP